MEGQRLSFSSSGTKPLAVDAILGVHDAAFLQWGEELSWSAQGAEPLVNQAEERFEWISRAQFDVDPPDADGQTGRNFKESQSDLANGGTFQFGTL